MDVSENTSEYDFLNKEQMSVFQEFEFDQQLKDFLAVLFDKFKVLSENLIQVFFAKVVEGFSNFDKNSINQLKDILIKIGNLSEKDYKESEKYFDAYYAQSEILINKFQDLALKNSSSLKEVFYLYITELSKIIEETPDNLYIGNVKNISNDNKTNVSIFIVDGDTIAEGASQIKFKPIIKEKVHQIFTGSFLSFIEAVDSFYYQKFVNFNRINQLLLSSVPPKESEITEHLKVCVRLPGELSQIVLLLDELSDFQGSKFEVYLKELKQNFNYKIENSFCRLIQLLDSSGYQAQNQVEALVFEILNAQLVQIIERSQSLYQSFFNEIKLEIQLGKTRTKLYQFIQTLYYQLEQLIISNLNERNEKLILDIQATIENYTQSKKPEIESWFKTNDKLKLSVYSEIENTIETTQLTIINLIKAIPLVFELVKDANFVDIKFELTKQPRTYKIPANKIIDEIIDSELFTAIHTLPLYLSNRMNEIDNEILNQNRLIKYSIFGQDSQQNSRFIENKEVDVLEFLNQKLTEAEQGRNNIGKINKSIHDDLLNAFYVANEKLNLDYFKDKANNWSNYVPKRKMIKGISIIKKLFISVGKLFDKLANKFWSHQSDALILAEDLLGKQTFSSSVFRFINKIEQITLNEKVRDELPFYYKHLFIDKNYFNIDFWIGRKKELERALIAFERFRSGIAGSLMITGKRFSGKSLMTRYYCSEILKSKKTIIIDAPEFGTIDTKLLLKKIQEQCGIKDDFSKVFSSLEPETIIVFEDLELWWEKSEIGNKAIQQIFDILEQYNQRIFFVVTMNSDSFMAIEKMIKFQSSFLDILYCKPVNSNTLQEIILFRHQASGLKFEFKKGTTLSGKITEESFKPKNFANLFSKYFYYSGGNIGVCLLAWISNIKKLEGNRIIMQLPKSSEISDFENLDKDDKLLLYQLLIHKKMDMPKICRVLLQSEYIVQKQMDFFIRAGIVNLQNNVYEINPYINHIVSAYLKNEDMI